MDTTILYTTDNSLDEEIANTCRKWLVKTAGDIPIVSVSQKPIDLGENICLGEMGRSWLSLHKQLLAGLQAVKTKYVAIAEHDCLYSTEHLTWTPPTDDTFYYNDNMWLLQWKGNHPEFEGMYSFWPGRYALSQLVSNRDLHLKSVEKRINIIDSDRGFEKQVLRLGEVGTTKLRGTLDALQSRAASGSCAYLRPLMKDFVAYLEDEKAEKFKTKEPTLDIRHGTNFTGPKRGKNRRWELPPWGKLEDLIRA